MSLFEFDEGRLIPAQFGRPVANGLTEDVLEAVRAQVLEIVSRPLFPITWRDMSRVADPTNEVPRLTALDASGQVVSVEVVEHLDSDTLIASLSRLADTASLSWTDLAREYPGDIDGFKAGWIHFRDSMPPSSASGPRLVMVVGSIDAQVRPALDVLASSGVEVHEMSLRQMSNGRAFLEVQAVGPRLYGHVPQVLLGRGSQMAELTGLGLDTGELPVGSSAAPASPVGTVAEGEGPGGEAGAGERPGAGEGREPFDEGGDTADEGASGRTAQAPWGDDAVAQAPWGDDVVEESPAGPDASVPGEDGEAAQAPTAPAHAATTWEEAVPAWERSAPVHGRHMGAESPSDGFGLDIAGPGVPGPDVPGLGVAGPDFGPVTDEVGTAQAAAEASSWSSVDGRGRTRGVAPEDGWPADGGVPTGPEEEVPVLRRDREGLSALAQIIGEEAPLALRPSLASTVEAVFTTRGAVRLPQGEYSDPTAALNVAGHPGLDGWEEWRLGDQHGPTLAESLDEVNGEIVREYSRAEAAGSSPRSARHR